MKIGTGDAKKKKKKKKPKKKAKTEQQSEPPRVGLSKLFPDGNYPEGELHEYKDEWVSDMGGLTDAKV
jgi:methionyl aminopeptidase